MTFISPKFFNVQVQVANSLTMVAESKLTEQLICKFCYHEDTATLN